MYIIIYSSILNEYNNLNISRIIEKIKFNIMNVQVFRLMGRLELIKQSNKLRWRNPKTIENG